MAKYPSTEGLQAALADVEPGDYTSSDLLPSFNAWAYREGRTQISAKTLGEAIKRELPLERVGRKKGVTVWHFTREGLACRNWFTVPPS